MRVIGICRFSYPALGGFKRMHDTVKEREAYLYAPARMELRFRHFECLTLPSIAAQQNPDFTFLVMIGQNMPKPYLDRLHGLTAPRADETPPCHAAGDQGRTGRGYRPFHAIPPG